MHLHQFEGERAGSIRSRGLKTLLASAKRHQGVQKVFPDA